MSDTVVAATIASLFSIITAVFTAVLSSRFYKQQTKSELEKEFASRFNERKWKTYTDFMNVLVKVFKTAGTDKKVNTPKILDELRTIAGDFWILAPDNVISAYTEWLRYSHAAKSGGTQEGNFAVLTKLAQVVIEMRKDLGIQNDATTALDLLSIYIPEIRKYVGSES